MTILEIVEKYLRENGYDGLYRDDEDDGCGCPVDDLWPCGECFCNCLPGVKHERTDGTWIIGQKEEK